MAELMAAVNGTEQRLDVLIAELKALRADLQRWRDRAPTGVEQRLDALIEATRQATGEVEKAQRPKKP